MGNIPKWRRESLEQSLASAHKTLDMLKKGRTAREVLDLLRPEGAPHRQDTSYAMLTGMLTAELELLVRDVQWVLDADDKDRG